MRGLALCEGGVRINAEDGARKRKGKHTVIDWMLDAESLGSRFIEPRCSLLLVAEVASVVGADEALPIIKLESVCSREEGQKWP